MVSLRLQRTGRRHHAQFRLVVQDSRRAPMSGRAIANLGFYNPHTKQHGIDLKKVAFYLENGAQPSSRVVKFLLDQKVDLPAWVKQPTVRTRTIKHPDKLRRNRPAPEPATTKEPASTPVKADNDEATAEVKQEEAPASAETEATATDSNETASAEIAPADNQASTPELEQVAETEAQETTDEKADTETAKN